jgi:hypothetical protein
MAGFDSPRESQPEKGAGSSSKGKNEFRRVIEEQERRKAQEAKEQEQQRKFDAERRDEVQQSLPNISDPAAMESQAFLAKVRERETRGFFRKYLRDKTDWPITSKEAITDNHRQFTAERVKSILELADAQRSDVFDITGYHYNTLKGRIESEHNNINILCDQFNKKGVRIDERRIIAHKISLHSDYLQLMYERLKGAKYLRGTDFVDESKLEDAYRRFQRAFDHRDLLIIRESSVESSYKIGNIMSDIDNLEHSTSDFAKEHHEALVKMKRLRNDQKSDFFKKIEKHNAAIRELHSLNSFFHEQAWERKAASSDMQDERKRYVEAAQEVISFEKYLRSKVVSIKDEPEPISPDIMDVDKAEPIGSDWMNIIEDQLLPSSRQAETKPFSPNPQPVLDWWTRQ